MFDGEGEMRRLMNLLMLSTWLFVVVQPEKLPTLGRTSRDHRRVQNRIMRSEGMPQVNASETDWWKTESVVSTKQFSEMTDRNLRLDAQGHPHIGYGSSGYIKYVYQDTSGWYTQTVGIGNYPTSLALDREGYPHFSYIGERSSIDYPTDYLIYAYRDAVGWHEQLVDGEVGMGTTTPLALDGDGFPHISYTGYDGLMYAYEDTAGWHIERVDSGDNPSLALDRDGYPHICYMSADELKYAYREASGWRIQMVDSEGAVGSPSLALDGVGRPRISYIRDNNLIYTIRYGAIWPLDSWGYGLPGSTITYTLQVLNTTQFTDTYDVAVSNYVWLTEVLESAGPLAPAESAALEVSVRVPATVTLGSEDTVTITVTLQGDSSKTGSATLTTFAGYVVLIPVIVK